MLVLPSFGPGGGGLIFARIDCLLVCGTFVCLFASLFTDFCIIPSVREFAYFSSIPEYLCRCLSGGLKVCLGLCVYIWIQSVQEWQCVCVSLYTGFSNV